jgi:hypothetical protein
MLSSESRAAGSAATLARSERGAELVRITSRDIPGAKKLGINESEARVASGGQRPRASESGRGVRVWARARGGSVEETRDLRAWSHVVCRGFGGAASETRETWPLLDGFGEQTGNATDSRLPAEWSKREVRWQGGMRQQASCLG